MSQTTLTELAQRRNDGLEITLLWAREDDSVQVAVLNERTGRRVAFPVERTKALDAFYHPFATPPDPRAVLLCAWLLSVQPVGCTTPARARLSSGPRHLVDSPR